MFMKVIYDNLHVINLRIKLKFLKKAVICRIHTNPVQYLILNLSQSTLQVGIKIRSLYWIQSVSQSVSQADKERVLAKMKILNICSLSDVFFLNLYAMQKELFIKECQSCFFIYSKREWWPLLSSKIYNEKWLTVNFSTHTKLSYGLRTHVEYFDIVLSQRFIYLFISFFFWSLIALIHFHCMEVSSNISLRLSCKREPHAGLEWHEGE